MKIVIGINSLTSTPYAAYTNHIGAFFRLGRWAERGGHQIILNNPERMSIDRMRNQCAKIAIETNADYLLFWDDDVIVPEGNFIQKMIDDSVDVVAADVIIRGYPFNHMAFLKKDDQPGLFPIQEIDPSFDPVFEVDAVGFSLCLIKVELLKKIASPWFVTGVSNTEDIYFCLKAKEYDKDCHIALDTSLSCGHILWHEIISKQNKKDFKQYIEVQHPEVIEQVKEKVSGDRGTEYLTQMEEIVK